LQAQGMWSASEGDDNERFLADLRGLRDTAALEFDELAARAHYPSDVLKEAASGPSLPSLPILAAYVRACEGDVPEWEERWRRLGFESRADPSLPVRPAGASAAAVAGARAGVSVVPPDTYDPERIRAALRGSHGRSDRGARDAMRQMAPTGVEPEIRVAPEPRVPESPASWNGRTSWDETVRWDAERSAETVTSWDAATQPGTGPQPVTGAQPGTGPQPGTDARWADAAADLTAAPANGNHHASQPGNGSYDGAVIDPPDAGRAEGEPSAAAPDSWFTPRDTLDPEPTWDTEPTPGAGDAWFAPRERADSGPTPSAPSAPEHAGSAPEPVTGFWTPSAAASAPTEPYAIPRASWPAPAETPASASDTSAAADRTTPIVAQAAAAAPPRTISGPAVPPGPVVPPSKSRSDRLYPVRLLVVIVVAALIGSILVLLLR
jgi:hypothetical protein